MIKSPNPETYFNNRDYGHTFKGFFYGIVAVLISLASVVWFITSDMGEEAGHHTTPHTMDLVG